MIRLLAACVVAVTLAGCGGDAPRPTPAKATATPLPSVGTLRLMKPPAAYYDDKQDILDVYVRFNRPVEPSDLGPDGYVALEALQGESVFGAATPDVRFPTCYSDSFFVGPVPAEGKRIVVTLKVGGQPGVNATATVHHLTHRTHPARELGCPRDPDGHVCSGTIATKRLTIRLETAYATSCAVALEVMTRVSRWANPHRCHYQLCVTRHRINRGFRCDAWFDNGGEGPPAYQIQCTRGRAIVRAFAD